jgi:outer membrane receptor protein involved in Fe transport
LLATSFIAGLAAATPAAAQTSAPVAPPQDPAVQAAPTDTTPATQENAADAPAPGPQDVEKGSAETIVVTGSRIVSPNIVSLAPVQVVGEEEIDRAGAINVQEVLNENPTFGTPTFSATNTAFLTSGVGIASVDLRQLGANRTLVLINGRRVVGGFQGSPIVDLNVIPTQFIERVDVLTGGASSLYGSDAVAGVVNFIYKRNFEGVLAEGQYGLTQRGDSQRYQVSATAGGNFMDGRGNIMIHLGYTNEKGLLSRKRKNTRVDDLSEIFYTGDPDDYGVEHEPYFSSYAPQGRFGAGGITYTYGPGGDLQPCFTTNGPSCAGGEGPNGFNRQFFRTLATPVKRYLLSERSHFDITDNISFITEATYAKTGASTEIEPFPLDSTNVYATGFAAIQSRVTAANGSTIIVDNPFVPGEILASAVDEDGDGLKDIIFRRRLSDVGQRTADARRNFFRIVTGFEGTLFSDRWHWDLTYNYGSSTEQQQSNGQLNVQNFANAFAAVQETEETGDLNGNGIVGDVTCADPNAVAFGCVPISIFGPGSITPAAANYIAAGVDHSVEVTQQVWNANMSGSLIDLPAGPLGVAVGAEYRKETSSEDWDALTNAGLNAGNALPDTSGKFNVKELYGEVNLPIFKDQPFARQLNLRLAGRLSDYSSIGSVATWNVGGDWSPIDAIRFRGTYAKATRAPNIGELFTGPSQTFPVGLVDPCEGIGLTGGGEVGDRCRAAPGVLANIQANGVFTLLQADNQGISGFNAGNVNLGPETAKTLTAGVVIAPRGIGALRNLVLSVDYYNIKVDDVIGSATRQTILNQCYNQGNTAFCDLITRRPEAVGAYSSGSLLFVNRFLLNQSRLKASGVDTVLSYRSGLGWLMGGVTLNARVAWTHLLKGFVVTVPGIAPDPFAGEIGTPKNKINGTLGFAGAKWNLSFSGTYIGKSYEDQEFLANFGLDHHAISIDPEFYLDAQVSFRPARTYEFFAGVDNLLDNQAPNILSGSPFNITGADTAAATYDVYGRRFYAGARLRF